MPIYEYQCTDCDFLFEISQSIKEKPKQKCPSCHKDTLERLISPVFGFCAKKENEMSTVGELAKHRRDHMTKWEKESADNEYAESSRLAKHKLEQQKMDAPWYRKNAPSVQKLASLSPEKKRKYIEKGTLD